MPASQKQWDAAGPVALSGKQGGGGGLQFLGRQKVICHEAEVYSIQAAGAFWHVDQTVPSASIKLTTKAVRAG